MGFQFFYRRRVVFSETDMAGIAHFSNFFRWMEEAEHAFYRSVGLSVHAAAEGEGGGMRTGWPRVKATAEYRLPLRFEEEFEIELLVAEMRSKAIRYELKFWKNPDGGAERKLAARGELVVVAVECAGDGKEMHAVAIPNVFRERIMACPAELLGASWH